MKIIKSGFYRDHLTANISAINDSERSEVLRLTADRNYGNGGGGRWVGCAAVGEIHLENTLELTRL